MSYLRDAMILLGIAGIGTGVYFFDWRMALIVVGALFVVLGTLSALTDAQGIEG